MPGIWIGTNDISASEFKDTPDPRKGWGAVSGYNFIRGLLPRTVQTRLVAEDGEAGGDVDRRGETSWVEIMVPIEAIRLLIFIEREVEPKIEGLFNKNFEQAVNHQAHLKWKKK